ncbi:MAG: diguanylate cyclase [Burkholderiaceae bacterium]|nr:diguanylate cyclase [Burkholderiaceae bacterium]
MTDGRESTKVAEARRTLALLQSQADGVRAQLSALRQDLAEVQLEFNGQRGVQLLEANEQLVLAALHAESIAETAISNLDDLARTSQRDPLTGLPNRALMRDRLDKALALARRRETRAAVLFVDIDHFKLINDTLGHAVGDELLQLVARRLESLVRDSDTVSRHGGDEFLVLLAEVGHASDAALIAVKMLRALTIPCHIEDQVFRVSASVGISIYPEDGTDAATLIRGADEAMYRAKKGRRGAYAMHCDLAPETEESASYTADLLQKPVSRSDFAPLEQAPMHQRNLREANEQLVLAAISAQELESEAADAHRRQIQFLAVVAHELRNPLAPIRTAAELLHSGRRDKAMLDRLQIIIERQVAHMARLVDDLLDGSRVGVGKFRLERSRIDLTHVLGVAIDTCRPAMQLRHQTLAWLPLPGPLLLQGDAVRLAQVFSNLIENASKYTAEGETITLSMQRLAQAVAVRISDPGIGISAQALPHIFDLFVQGPQTLLRHNSGLGIGLAVVRNLVEAHGGTVVASSAGVGKGSEFVVTLPLVI